MAQRNVNFNWVQQLERQTALPVEESYFIGIDAEKNVYVAGNFHNTIDLDLGAGVTNVTARWRIFSFPNLTLQVNLSGENI